MWQCTIVVRELTTGRLLIRRLDHAGYLTRLTLATCQQLAELQEKSSNRLAALFLRLSRIQRAEALIREAHKAMHEARRRGGDHTVLASLDTGKWVTQRLAVAPIR